MKISLVTNQEDTKMWMGLLEKIKIWILIKAIMKGKDQKFKKKLIKCTQKEKP